MAWWEQYQFYKPQASAEQVRRRAEKAAGKLSRSAGTYTPVRLEGKTLARSFWGKAWCANLESYSDYSNRLPRGRMYVRNGSVVHLEIRQGEIEALVSGSRLYTVKIKISPVKEERWKALCRECAGGIGSLMELLAGKLSQRVMEIMTRRDFGLFPSPKEIKLDCSCPDWAEMCKHVAAALYGVGARLDEKPELLFLLRHVSHQDLVSGSAAVTALTGAKAGGDHATLSTAEIGEVFGIELAAGPAAPDTPAPAPGPAMPQTGRKAQAKPPRRKTAKKPSAKSPGRATKRKAGGKARRKTRGSGLARKAV